MNVYKMYGNLTEARNEYMHRVRSVTGGLGELALTGGIEATVQDFAIGWPGLLLQIIGAYLVCKYL